MTPKPDIVLVGHITRDLLPGGGWRMGGSVVYAAHLAARWGFRPAVLTSAASHDEVVAALPVGTDVETVPSFVTTTFENVESTPRKQYVKAVASPLPVGVLPSAWRLAAALVAPLIGEADPTFLDEARFVGPVGVCLQGWLRSIGSDGQVRNIDARLVCRRLPPIAVAFVSVEDLSNTPDSETVLRDIAGIGTYVLVTAGDRGSTLFSPEPHHVPAVPARAVDTTGAGDVFAAALFLGLLLGETALSAARLAAAAAACAVEGEGVSAIPSLAEARRRELEVAAA